MLWHCQVTSTSRQICYLAHQSRHSKWRSLLIKSDLQSKAKSAPIRVLVAYLMVVLDHSTIQTPHRPSVKLNQAQEAQVVTLTSWVSVDRAYGTQSLWKTIVSSLQILSLSKRHTGPINSLTRTLQELLVLPQETRLMQTQTRCSLSR